MLLALPYSMIIPPYLVSSGWARTTLNFKANKAELFYFQYYFVNYL